MKKFLKVTFAVGAWLVGALVQMPVRAQVQSVEPVPVPAKKRAVEKSAEKKAADKRAAQIAAEDAPVKANGGVFKCVDRDGNITYGNVGNVKGCKQIETDTVNSVPFPKPASTAARSFADASRPSSAKAGSAMSSSGSTAATRVPPSTASTVTLHGSSRLTDASSCRARCANPGLQAPRILRKGRSTPSFALMPVQVLAAVL